MRKSPFELFFCPKPELRKLRTFGCTVFMQKRKPQRSKLVPRGVKCKFLGYDDCSLSYVVQEIDPGKTHFARNTIFNENEIPSSDVSGVGAVRSQVNCIINFLKTLLKRRQLKVQLIRRMLKTQICVHIRKEKNNLMKLKVSLVDDRTLFEISDDVTKRQEVKETEENGKVLRANLTSLTVKFYSQDKLLDVYPVRTLLSTQEPMRRKINHR